MNRRWIRAVTLPLFAFAGGMCAQLLTGQSASAAPQSESPYFMMGQLGHVVAEIENEYVDPVDRRRLLEGAAKGMVAELDPHSSYFAAQDYTDFNQQTEGQFAGFCPSCLGRKMCATAAHLMDDVMPRAVPLRQWVLTMPFSWRKRLAYDGALWSALTRVFTKVVSRFYGKHGGAVIALQRTSSDMKLNPHVHAVFLDGHYVERAGELEFETRSRVSTSDVAHVLQHTRDKMFAHLRRRGMLAVDAENDNEMTPLAASAVAGTTPPAGPEWRRGKLPLTHQAMTVERPLCVALDGFTLHAATRAGAMDADGREALLKYILRPSVAQERVTRGPDGLVRIALKKAFADGTVAIDMDPLSLLSRLAASVPPPKFHTVHYSGVLASASKLRSRIAPKPLGALPPDTSQQDERPARRGAYRPWADLLRRTFGFDVLQCPNCKGRMRLLAIVTEPKSIARYLRSLGEPTSIPEPEPARGPPYWKSRILRRAALGDEAA